MKYRGRRDELDYADFGYAVSLLVWVAVFIYKLFGGKDERTKRNDDL